MKRPLLVLAVAIFLPSLLLGSLALRTVNAQQIVLERQTAVVYQRYTDTIAGAIRRAVAEERRAFAETVSQLLLDTTPQALAPAFTSRLADRWPRAQVGFAVTLDGRIFSPTEGSILNPSWEAFLSENRAFLSSQITSEIYQLPAPEDDVARAPLAGGPAYLDMRWRNVQPQQGVSSKGRQVFIGKGQVVPTESNLAAQREAFSTVVASMPSGTIARFVQNRLELLFWFRPAQAPDMVFGAMLTPEQLQDLWMPALSGQINPIPDTAVAILNERAKPVARTITGFEADWKHPFVASEIGDVLPHWEVALYLTNPRRFTDAARTFRLSLLASILLSLAAIGYGGYLVIIQTRRQLARAQQKADFVSNVSHELKSPLTSIRMFAELLEQNRVPEPDKRNGYLRIIALEADRLTRLINNVLDFAKLERNQKRFDKRTVDLHPVIQQTWESCEAHLRSEGFTTTWQAAPPPYEVFGDPDAIAQILVNLLSNAEKYSPETKEVSLHTSLDDRQLTISVSDRGLGVPPGHERRIFEPFHRAHDALSNGIQGSGLGLTLAQRLASEHGGAITYRPREGGGSVFTLRLPRMVTAPKP